MRRRDLMKIAGSAGAATLVPAEAVTDLPEQGAIEIVWAEDADEDEVEHLHKQLSDPDAHHILTNFRVQIDRITPEQISTGFLVASALYWDEEDREKLADELVLAGCDRTRVLTLDGSVTLQHLDEEMLRSELIVVSVEGVDEENLKRVRSKFLKTGIDCSRMIFVDMPVQLSVGGAVVTDDTVLLREEVQRLRALVQRLGGDPSVA